MIKDNMTRALPMNGEINKIIKESNVMCVSCNNIGLITYDMTKDWGMCMLKYIDDTHTKYGWYRDLEYKNKRRTNESTSNNKKTRNS